MQSKQFPSMGDERWTGPGDPARGSPLYNQTFASGIYIKNRNINFARKSSGMSLLVCGLGPCRWEGGDLPGTEVQRVVMAQGVVCCTFCSSHFGVPSTRLWWGPTTWEVTPVASCSVTLTLNRTLVASVLWSSENDKFSQGGVCWWCAGVLLMTLYGWKNTKESKHQQTIRFLRGCLW